MESRSRADLRLSRGALALVCALLLVPGISRGAVQVGITPATITVSPNDTFDLDLTVTQPGSAFNGFDVTVSFNPAMLTLLPLSPTTLQQGCLMTGACSIACGSTFHRFTAGGDSAAITDILLCNQIALNGPGQAYKLRFQAGSTQGTTQVQIRQAVFYNAGLFVTPVLTANATVTISSTVGVGDPAPRPPLGLRAEPNPATGPVAFAVESDGAGEQWLEVHDPAGRLVRTLERGWRAPGARRVAWDGRDASGARVPSGVYLVTLGSGGRTVQIRVALLR